MKTKKDSQHDREKYVQAISYLNSMDRGQGGYLGEIAVMLQELLDRADGAEDALAMLHADVLRLQSELRLKNWAEQHRKE